MTAHLMMKSHSWITIIISELTQNAGKGMKRTVVVKLYKCGGEDYKRLRKT
jgi:hypothetical protein